MLLELTEALRCPRPHEESYVICVPITRDGVDVVRGGLFCPVCKAEYAILDRVVWFAPPGPAAADVAASELSVKAALTFLDLQGQGGFVVLAGNAGRLAAGLAAELPGVGVVAVNPPEGVEPSVSLTVVRTPAWPFRQMSIRAGILGSDVASGAWLEGASASVLPGLRLIVEDENAQAPGMADLARGAGIVVGERQSR